MSQPSSTDTASALVRERLERRRKDVQDARAEMLDCLAVEDESGAADAGELRDVAQDEIEFLERLMAAMGGE